MGALNQFWSLITGTNKQGPAAQPQILPYDYSGLYQALYDLYNNDDDIADEDTTRRLRTVVNRSVEFYAGKILPGEIEVLAPDNPPLVDPIKQILKDSNFGNNKPAMLRGFALYGDSFVRVRGDDQKCYLEDISPFYVTDFGEDSRGFLTYARIDVPILDDRNLPALYTEYWDAETRIYRSWITNLASSTPIADLGAPKETTKFASLGIDFIPIVHTKFRDNGDPRGVGSVYHALDKIYEANRIATRLHDMLFAFGEPLFVASANDKDAAGRPLPPPKVTADSVGGAVVEAAKSILGRIVSLPGMAKLESLVPNIDYSDALAILNAQMAEIETDCPELKWYSITDKTGMSGKAIRDLLGAAVDRAKEAQENFKSSLSRMIEMALTIGQFNNLFPSTLGQFDTGDFSHTLQVADAWGDSVEDKAATMATLTGAGVPAPAAMKLAGFSDDQVNEAFPNGNQPPKPVKIPTAPGKPTNAATPAGAVRVA